MVSNKESKIRTIQFYSYIKTYVLEEKDKFIVKH